MRELFKGNFEHRENKPNMEYCEDKLLQTVGSILQMYVHEMRMQEFDTGSPSLPFSYHIKQACTKNYCFDNNLYKHMMMSIQNAMCRADKPCTAWDVENAVKEVRSCCLEYNILMEEGVLRPIDYERLCFNDCARSLGLPDDFLMKREDEKPAGQPQKNTDDAERDGKLDVKSQEQEVRAEDADGGDDEDADDDQMDAAHLVVLVCKLLGKNIGKVINASKMGGLLARINGMKDDTFRKKIQRLKSKSGRMQELECDAASFINELNECFREVV